MTHEPWTLSGLHAAVHFTVEADCAAGLLPRLIEPFAKRDITPDTLNAHRVGEVMHVEIAMRRMPAESVQVVEGNLRQVVGVRLVTLRQEITGWVQRRAA